MSDSVDLIELFAGYGSQALALKRIGVKVNPLVISEWYKNAILAYNALHNNEKETKDLSFKLSREQLVDFFVNDFGLSLNSKEPVSRESLLRVSEKELRTLYNCVKQAKNVGSICNIHGFDINITAEHSLLTYSFPCQDISSASLGKGFSADSGTRSSLVWQVGRILSELKESGNRMPEVLLMENVSAIVSRKFIKTFESWVSFLKELGYDSYYQIVNASSYLPQNRERCFLVSYRSDLNMSSFPQLAGYNLNCIGNAGAVDLSEILKGEYLRIQNEPVNSLYSTQISELFERVPEVKEFIDHNGFCVVAMRGRNPEKPSLRTKGSFFVQRFEPKLTGITNCITSCQKDSMLLYKNNSGDYGFRYFTVLEVFQLMGLTFDEAKRIQEAVQSKTACLLLAANSIVVPVLEDIFFSLYSDLGYF